jgi:cysteine desulfurase
LPATTEKLRRLRDRLWDQLRTRLGDRIVLNGHAQHRLPNTLNVNFVGQVGVDLLKAVPEVAASTGSACHEADQERHFSLSPVLAAMGVPLELGKGAIRLTVGRFTTEDEVDRAAAALSAACR